MIMEKQHFEVISYGKPLIFFMTKIVIFDRGLSQGVSKIGPTHQITLSTDLGEYRETFAEIRWIESKRKRFFKPRLSAQEADNVGLLFAAVILVYLFRK